MKILFMGTPDFAVPILNALITRHEICAVVTQPDRPRGRGQAMAFSAVKQWAAEKSLPVLQPETLKHPAAQAEIGAFEAEAFVVAAYGLFLPKKVRDMPKFGCINVHGSLLPQYRGASPMQRTILNGDTETGITIIHMSRGIDTGDMILRRAIPVGAEERIGALHDRMAVLGGECILEALAQLENQTAKRIPQDEAAATCAPMISKEDGHINWHEPSVQIKNRLRAMDPWPGTYALYEGQVLKVWDCVPVDFSLSDSEPLAVKPPGAEVPGTVLAVDSAKGFSVKTGDGAVWVTEVQAVGGRRMKTADYLRGHEVRVGVVLG